MVDKKAEGAPAAGLPAEKLSTKIKVIGDAQATGETAAAYDFWRKGSGRQQVPGIIKCFGARPDFLQQVLQFSNTIHFSEGHLSRRHKERSARSCSSLNQCPYGRASNAYSLRVQGTTQQCLE